MAGISVFWNAPKKEKGREFVFGSITERKMFPVYTIPTRMGIEQGLRGQPNTGPGRYAPHPSTLFLQAMDDQLKSRRGCGFGVRDSKRILFNIKEGPSPADHQTLADPCKRTLSPAFTLPFSAATPRFQQWSNNLEHLGPGSHDHDVVQFRHVNCHESFGGPRTLKGPVPVKCTLGIPDKCKCCGVDLIGDYYCNKTATICRSCYAQLSSNIVWPSSNTKPTSITLPSVGGAARIRTSGKESLLSSEGKHKEFNKEEKGSVDGNEEGSVSSQEDTPTTTHISLKNMQKIRDCSSIHRHQFPGTLPKTIIMSDADQRKRARREAYLQLYF